MQKGSKSVLVPLSVTDMRMETCLRYGTLLLVVLQTTATVLLMRYSRTREGTQYLASTAVFLAEVMKVLVCYVILLAQNGIWFVIFYSLRNFSKIRIFLDFSMKTSHELFVTEVVKRPKETLKMIIPSGLYTIQNNLLYTALTNLDAGTYQVCALAQPRS
jgi:UDP-sugar transporter A1/2/3